MEYLSKSRDISAVYDVMFILDLVTDTSHASGASSNDMYVGAANFLSRMAGHKRHALPQQALRCHRCPCRHSIPDLITHLSHASDAVSSCMQIAAAMAWQGASNLLYLSKSRDVIDAHAIVGVQDSYLPSGADGQPAPQILGGVEGEGMENEQRQGEVVDPVPPLRKADVGLVGLVHLAQHPASACPAGS